MNSITKTLGLAAAASATLLAVGAGSASASTINGSLTPIAVNNGYTAGNPPAPVPIQGGNSDTPFGVKLQGSPAANGGGLAGQAYCSADSATGATEVYTYLIHANEDPTKLDFTQGNPGVLPDGSTVLVFTDSQGTVQTTQGENDQNTASGTGQIILPPTVAYQWGQLAGSFGIPVTGPDGLVYDGTSGKWLAGFACFKQGAPGRVTDYWQTPITFSTDAANGGRQGFDWTTANAGTGPGSVVPEAPLPILLPLGGAALVAGGAAFTRRRRRQATA